MKRSNTRSLLRRSLRAAVLALVALLATSCVSSWKHRAIVGELDEKNKRLSARVRDLERSTRSLGEERVRLIDEMEDLRQARGNLETDVAKLQRSKDLLSEHLRQREQQLRSRSEEVDRLKSTYRGLVDDLESEVAAGQIQIEQLREGLRLNLSQDVLFPSGSARLDDRGAAVLRKVAVQLRKVDYRVEVQGHTDDVPVGNSGRFGSNWELAGARAAQVVRILEAEALDPKRMKVVSFGENVPVASNETPEGRARNRRIEIRLIPEDAAAPAAAAAAQ